MTNTTTRLRTLTMVALAASALAVFGLPARAAAQNAGDAVNGKRVFLAVGCFECHGRAGQGGAMNYPTPALAQLEMPAESFVAFLRDAPKDMPAYSEAVMSDKEIADIYTFVQSLPGRLNAKDIAILND